MRVAQPNPNSTTTNTEKKPRQEDHQRNNAEKKYATPNFSTFPTATEKRAQ